MAGSVGSRAGPLDRRALAELGRMAAERALVDPAVFRTTEWNAVMLKFIYRLRGFARQIFHSVHVAEPVRTFHRVVHMPLPMVGTHVPERGGDAALGGHRMRAGRKNLGDASRAQALLGHPQCRPKSCSPGSDNNYIVLVLDELVGICHSSAPFNPPTTKFWRRRRCR